jgi:hypothetical protein
VPNRSYGYTSDLLRQLLLQHGQLVDEVFLKWVEGETPPSLKKNEKYAFLAPVALYF